MQDSIKSMQSRCSIKIRSSQRDFKIKLKTTYNIHRILNIKYFIKSYNSLIFIERYKLYILKYILYVCVIEFDSIIKERNSCVL